MESSYITTVRQYLNKWPGSGYVILFSYTSKFEKSAQKPLNMLTTEELFGMTNTNHQAKEFTTVLYEQAIKQNQHGLKKPVICKPR